MNDNFEIKGEVVLLRDDGEVLLEKKNMVVAGGRRAVFDAFFPSMTFENNKPNITAPSANQIQTIQRISLGYNDNLTPVTADTDNIAIIPGKQAAHIYLSGVLSAEISPENIFDSTDLFPEVHPGRLLKVYFDRTNMKAMYYLSLYHTTLTTQYTFNNLGLYTQRYDESNGNYSNSKLFSRLNHEDIGIENGYKYCLKYTIYF